MSSGLAKRLKELRTSKGITQGALGKACGVSRAAVAQWEKGDTAPTLDKLEALTGTLDADPVYLLSGKHSTYKTDRDLAHAHVPVPEYNVRLSAGGSFHISEETKRDVWLFSRRYLADELRLPASRLVVLVGSILSPITSSTAGPSLTPPPRYESPRPCAVHFCDDP